MELKGKVALVTGGAVRVGKAISLMLAREGANIVVNYNRSEQAAAETLAVAQALGVEAVAMQADVSEWTEVEQMVKVIGDRFGGVDVIVNSASHFGRTPFPSDQPEVRAMWERVTRVLVDGPYFVCNALAPGMLKRGGGAIVNIVDMAAWQPWRGFAAHAVGKAALMGLTRQLALELAPTVRVNAVAPGPVLPPVGFSENQIEAFGGRTLLGRWGTPEDVAQAVRYLITAEYVTGEVITVDGGERYWRG
jgi:3-oxoacyl-[acyl-carrier protein] reductase/pteridine reductase